MGTAEACDPVALGKPGPIGCCVCFNTMLSSITVDEETARLFDIATVTEGRDDSKRSLQALINKKNEILETA